MIAVTHYASVGEIVISGVGVMLALVFGRPAWQLARRSEKQAEAAAVATEERARTEAIAIAVAQYLGVPIPSSDGTTEPSPTSVIELLGEIRDYQEEQSTLALILAFHMADDHGDRVPEWVLIKERLVKDRRRQDGSDGEGYRQRK